MLLKPTWTVGTIMLMRGNSGGYNMPRQTVCQRLFFLVCQFNKHGFPRGAQCVRPFPLLNKGLDVRVKCQCQDTKPPAANVLAHSLQQMAVWVMARCQASIVTKETNTNKQAEEWTFDPCRKKGNTKLH